MTSDPVREAIDAARTRVTDELDSRLAPVMTAHEEALRTARQEAELAAEGRWSALLADVRSQVQHDIQTAVASARAEFEAAREDLAARELNLLQALRDLTQATSLVGILDAAARVSAGQVPDCRVFVRRGNVFERWRTSEGPGGDLLEIVREAQHTAHPVFREARFAVPVRLDGRAVAVLGGRQSSAEPDWKRSLELLSLAIENRLAAVISRRLVDAGPWLASSRQTATPALGPSEDTTPLVDDVAARRYARLLISEIKLYNEAAVREGREHRDLLLRLQPQIERARHSYERRVVPQLLDRHRHFEEELVRTLAGGDASLLA